MNKTLLDTLSTAIYDLPEPMLCKSYFFHNIRVTCHTNHPSILTILDEMLGIFPESSILRGESTYYVFCYERASQFRMQVPSESVRIETVRLTTRTKLAFDRSPDHLTEYQSYAAFPPYNAAALTAISLSQNVALTQLEMPERYQVKLLRRYVLLFALGELMRPHGFEVCHGATITSPWNTQQGALIIGTSGQGKTTLSLGCTSRGECGLLGDDLIMLRRNDMDGTIDAYAITHEVSVRPGTLDLWPALSFLRSFPADDRDKRYCNIEQVRAGSARLQTSVRLLLFPSLTTGTQSTVTPLSKASTLQELIAECVSKRNRSSQAQQRLFSLLSQLAERTTGYRLAIAQGASDGPQIVRSLFQAVSYD